MKAELNGLSDLEIRTQRAYATRQFAWFHAMQQCSLAKGNVEAARAYADHMAECNDFIDSCNRKLGDVA